MPTAIPEKELRQKLAQQSYEAIKTLIQSAELSRRINSPQSTDYFNLFFKEAKKHLI